MAGQSKDSVLNSLRGKIWLAVSGLALLNCAFGLAAYLIASFVISDVFFSLFIASITAGFTTMVFGWWLSNEVLRPIDQVNFIAKSLERSPTTSLPKSTGSSETDELLLSLTRNSQQLQNLIGMMDDVANGKTKTALAPLQNADRLSISFQKLVSKVTESIDAKRDLGSLRRAIVAVERSAARMLTGKFDAALNDTNPATKEISGSLSFLAEKINEMALNARSNAGHIKHLTSEIDSMVLKAIDLDEKRAARIRRTSAKMLASPKSEKTFSDALADAVTRIAPQIESLAESNGTPVETIDSAESLRKQLNEILRKINKVRDNATNISDAARSSGELARRSNLVALNASLNNIDPASLNASAPFLADELSSISSRAEKLNKNVESVNESIARDLADLVTCVQKAVGESSATRKRSLEMEEALSAFRTFAVEITETHTKLIEFDSQNSAKKADLNELIEVLASDDDRPDPTLRSAERRISSLFALAAELEDSTAFVQLPDPRENLETARPPEAETPEKPKKEAIAEKPETQDLWLMREP